MMGKFLAFALTMFFAFSADAQVRNYQQCGSNETSRTELDMFCPRIEGIHVEGCCPPLAKVPPLKCKYQIVDQYGQPYLVKSTSTSCKEVDGVKQNVTTECCTINRKDCTRQPIELDFIPRLLHRTKTCCFENCPTADYWRAPPAKGGLTQEHVLTPSFGNNCTDEVIDQCEVGDTANCPADDFCPGPTPGPQPTIQPAPSSTPPDATPTPSQPEPSPQPPSPPKPKRPDAA